jgi:hypothetical protein
MSSNNAFSPPGVIDLAPDEAVDEPRFEPVVGPEREDGLEEGEEYEEFSGPSEEEIRRELHKEEPAVASAQVPKSGSFAPNLRVTRPAEKLAPIPTHPDIAELVKHESAKNALRRLQSTRSVLSEHLKSLQKYLSEGGVASRLQDRARELEIRSSDPVWLVVEACLDSAWRITSGLEIFSESLGVYLEYEFTKVQLYDTVIARLEQALAENEQVRGEFQQTRSLLEGVQKQLFALEGNQYGAVNALPGFAKNVAAQFGKALESGQKLSDKTEAASKRISALSLWVKVAVVTTTLCLAACVVVAWLLISRGQ